MQYRHAWNLSEDDTLSGSWQSGKEVVMLVPGPFGGSRCRSLFPWDERRYRDHLINLSTEDRRLRFMGGVSDDFIATHVRKTVFHARTKVIGWFHEGTLNGAVELNWTADRICEVAFSVDPDYRSQGVGTTLTRRAIRAARNRGITRIVVHTESTNLAMRRLGERFQAGFRSDGCSVEGIVETGHANMLSIMLEVAEDAGFPAFYSFADQRFERQRHR